jgi:hypothetical protein
MKTAAGATQKACSLDLGSGLSIAWKVCERHPMFRRQEVVQ